MEIDVNHSYALNEPTEDEFFKLLNPDKRINLQDNRAYSIQISDAQYVSGIFYQEGDIVVFEYNEIKYRYEILDDRVGLFTLKNGDLNIRLWR